MVYKKTDLLENQMMSEEFYPEEHWTGYKLKKNSKYPTGQNQFVSIGVGQVREFHTT